MSRIKFMNISIDNLTMSEAINQIKNIIDQKKRIYVVTPNVDHIVKIENNNGFKNAYDNAGLVLVDGTPIMLISKLYRQPLKEKITGPKLSEKVIELASKNHYSVYFLGGKEGIAEEAAKRMVLKYPGFLMAGCYSPKYGFEKDNNEIQKIISKINIAKPQILLCGMGSPKTEIFLNKYMDQLNTNVAFSIGAAIDFMSGNIKRCPKWINDIGMEWLYRFVKEPKRMFKRYFVDDIKILELAIKYRRK